MHHKVDPHGELTLRTIAMPADTNSTGDIFGGWVMAQMDLAEGIVGVERATGQVITVAVDGMHFIQPVKVGDVLCVDTSVERAGGASITSAVAAWAHRFRTRTREKVTSAAFTFVAVDDAGNACSVTAPATATA